MTGAWKSCREELPGETGKYLVCLRSYIIDTMWWSQKHKRWNVTDDDGKKQAVKFGIDGITHWMELPELPDT